MVYRFFWGLIRIALHLFFRQIEVEGESEVPVEGPVLFVPNHTNALVDPLIVGTVIDRRLTLTAKNVLAKNPLLGWLMRAAGVVTFHRREDVGKGADRRENVHSLQRCRELLAAGGAICIFPEGVSHSDPKLRPFRLGPARIALDFLRKDGNPGGLRIVPVGLLYTEKDQFRSGVWLRFGSPIDVARWVESNPDGDALALTNEIRQRVEALTLNYETRRESLVLSHAAEIVATAGQTPETLGRSGPSVSDRFRLVRRLQQGYQSLSASHAVELDDLSQRIRRHRADVRRLAIEPAEVYLPLHPGRALLFLVRELELILVGLPLAALGILNHLLPYLIVRYIARKMSVDKDQWASNVVYPGLAVFPFFYAVQLTATWLLLPTMGAILYTVALPYTGYYALLYRDRSLSSWQRARTFLFFLWHRAEQTRLATEGRAIIAQIRDLAEAQTAAEVR
jgi:glycerol-3-phosphate O-acyltransferase/dihydroxyacetone phosphate acyltransferase